MSKAMALGRRLQELQMLRPPLAEVASPAMVGLLEKEAGALGCDPWALYLLLFSNRSFCCGSGAKMFTNWRVGQANNTSLIFWSILCAYPGFGKSEILERVLKCLLAAMARVGLEPSDVCDDANTPEGRNLKLRTSSELINSQDEAMNLFANLGRVSKSRTGELPACRHAARRSGSATSKPLTQRSPPTAARRYRQDAAACRRPPDARLQHRTGGEQRRHVLHHHGSDAARCASKTARRKGEWWRNAPS
jgi:hypothetical protein